VRSAPSISPTSQLLVTQLRASELLLELESLSFEGRVRVAAESGHGEVLFQNGDIVGSAFGVKEGRSAVLAILALSRSEWIIESCHVEKGPVVVENVNALLLRDETSQRHWHDLCARAPAMASVLRLSVEGQRVRDIVSHSSSSLLAYVDGVRTLSQLLEQCELDPVMALEQVIDAIDRDWVRVASTRQSLFPLANRSELAERRIRSDQVSPSIESGQVATGIEETGVQSRREEPIVSVTESTIANSNAWGEDPLSQSPRRHSRKSIGRYELLTRIGHGGMGTVYLCRTNSEQTGFRRHFALKLLRSHLSDDPSATEAFLAEARIAGVIHHANVISVLDAGFHDHRPYLVMDYVEGCSLRQLIRAPDGKSPKLLLPVIIDALTGLSAVHTLRDDEGVELGLVHCDISPENLLVGIDGSCRLTDFGISRSIHFSNSGVTQGKLGYLAPEQIAGSRFDQRADLFSMGVVLWNALTGRELFSGKELERRLSHPFEFSAPAPQETGAESSPALDRVILRALAGNPKQRFESAQEMLHELQIAAQLTWKLATTNDIEAWVRNTAGTELALRRLTVLDISRDANNSVQDFPSTRLAVEKEGVNETEPIPLTCIASTPPRSESVSSAAVGGSGTSTKKTSEATQVNFYKLSDFVGYDSVTAFAIESTLIHPTPAYQSRPVEQINVRVRWAFVLIVILVSGLIGYFITNFITAPTELRPMKPATVPK
jgi:serine/threonine-protein kinase